jgi:NADP-dependent 3-hydroxy acid dehydrogenase YdfG
MEAVYSSELSVNAYHTTQNHTPDYEVTAVRTSNANIMIISLCSIAGHTVLPIEHPFFMYSASKHAVTALTEGLRLELVQQKSQIRVTVSINSY